MTLPCRPLGLVHINERDTPTLIETVHLIFLFKNRHLWTRYLKVDTSSIRESNSQQISVEFSNISLFKSDWTIKGMNLIINQSDLVMTQLNLRMESVSESGFVKIYNSSFGKLKVLDKYDIEISDSRIEGTFGFKDSLIEITNYTLNISESVFSYHWTFLRPAVLNALSSTVYIWRTRFTKNHGGTIIQIYRGNVYMRESDFDWNGILPFSSTTTIHVAFNSRCFISASNFSWNFAISGGALRVEGNSVITVDNTNFYYNKAIMGGAIFCQDNVLSVPSTALQNTFYVNVPEKSIKPSAETAENYPNVTTCLIRNSSFEGNWVMYGGGDIYLNGASLELLHKYFSASFANVSGGSIISYQGNVSIFSTTFKDGHTTLGGGVLHATDDTIIFVNDSKIIGDFIGLAGCLMDLQNKVIMTVSNSIVNITWAKMTFITLSYGLWINFKDHCSVTVNNVVFIHTNAISPCVFGAQSSSTLLVTDSTFTKIPELGSHVMRADGNNTAHFIGCIFNRTTAFYISGNSSVLIEDGLITDSQHVADGAIMYVYESNLNILNTNITDNFPNKDLSFIYVSFLHAEASNVTLTGSYYARNAMKTHLDVTVGSSLALFNSQFEDNRIICNIFCQLLETVALYSASVIRLRSSSYFFASKTTFHDMMTWNRTLASFFLSERSDIVFSHCHLLRVRQLLSYSDNVTFESSLVENPNLAFVYPKKIRLAESQFSAESQYRDWILNVAGLITFVTFTSNITSGNKTIQTQDKDFIRQLKDRGILNVIWPSNARRFETQYASSKFFFSLYITLTWPYLVAHRCLISLKPIWWPKGKKFEGLSHA